jgi:hypothetical protein
MHHFSAVSVFLLEDCSCCFVDNNPPNIKAKSGRGLLFITVTSKLVAGVEVDYRLYFVHLKPAVIVD